MYITVNKNKNCKQKNKKKKKQKKKKQIGHKGIMYMYLQKCPKILNLEHCWSEGRCSRNGN